MTHRAEQILTAVTAAIAARVEKTGVKVYTHRRLSLDPEQDELPAISVDYGEDRRADSQTLGTIASFLSVEVTAIVAKQTEPEAREQLLELRAEIHRAVMANPKQGIPDVVVSTYYGGAAAPEVDTDGEQIVAALTSTWIVHYRMDLADPA